MPRLLFSMSGTAGSLVKLDVYTDVYGLHKCASMTGVL